MSAEPMTIVLAEDDDGHAALVERNFRRCGIANPFIRVTDGQAALDYIHGDAVRGRPSGGSVLLLMDIKMPRMDGIEALQRIKQDPATDHLPVIMLTTTDDPREIEKCYELGCNVFITKPVDYAEFVEAIKRLGLFLAIVQLPREAAAREPGQLLVKA